MSIEGQRVIAMLVAGDENEYVLTATENGFGKRTPIGEYTRHGRGTKGMIAIQTSERNGNLVGAALVNLKDELMLISTAGVLIRTKAADISEMGRSTQGVTLISLDQGSRLAGIEKIGETEEEASVSSNGGDAGNGNESDNSGDVNPQTGVDSEGGNDAPGADSPDSKPEG